MHFVPGSERQQTRQADTCRQGAMRRIVSGQSAEERGREAGENRKRQAVNQAERESPTPAKSAAIFPSWPCPAEWEPVVEEERMSIRISNDNTFPLSSGCDGEVYCKAKRGRLFPQPY